MHVLLGRSLHKGGDTMLTLRSNFAERPHATDTMGPQIKTNRDIFPEKWDAWGGRIFKEALAGILDKTCKKYAPARGNK